MLSASFGSATTIAGGAGNDTIFIASGINSAGFTGKIAGGAGNDSIFIGNDLNTSGSQDMSAMIFAGGAGADTVAISGGTLKSGTTTLGTLELSALTDSTAGAFDVVDLTGTTQSGALQADLNVVFDTSATLTAVGASTAAVLFGDASSKATMDASGIVTFSGGTVASSVTAAAASVDTLTLDYGKGTVALFATSGGDEYLFIQGGTSGTSDDAVIGFKGLSANALATASSVIVNFSGSGS